MLILTIATALLVGEPSPPAARTDGCDVAMRNDSTALLAAFNQRWADADYPPIVVSASGLEQAEGSLGVTYPGAYRSAVLAVGLPRPTADLWDAIDEETDLPHLADFLAPEDAVESAIDWRPMGYPEDLAPFATDSGGNLLSFRAGDGDAVHIWDHEFGTLERVAPSFAAFLQAYCALPDVAA